MKKLKHKIQRLIYRMMRDNMVARMRVNGHSWSRINNVLRVCGQKQIVKIVHTPNGMLLTYGYLKERVRTRIDRHGKIENSLELEAPEVIVQR